MKYTVALRKESVDRNDHSAVYNGHCKASLSARRAWIEIRNIWYSSQVGNRSLSARRAWIEIVPLTVPDLGKGDVALRKESVDRNKTLIDVAKMLGVALRKESVDRNTSTAM